MENRTTQDLIDQLEIRNKWYTAFSLFLRVITLIGVIFAVALILQNQANIKAQINETKRQSMVNQQYIRCIVLLPASTYQDANNRTKAVDDCAAQSRLPNVNPIR